MVTGGHLTPALACIDELLAKKDIEIVFVGKKYNNEREKTLSLEYKEITAKPVPFINLKAGRLSRSFSLRTIQNLVNIPASLWESYFILSKEKPDKILSFGGYIALPICLISLIWGIPFYTHEQTIQPGLTNRILGFFSKKIFVSFKETKKYFPKNKVIITGNPIRRQVFEIIKKPFLIEEKLPVIYVTGGSLGSHSINEHMKKILASLLERYVVVHQTGNLAEYQDYEKLIHFKTQLPENLQKRYFLKQHLNADEVGYVYKNTNLFVSRAGANTFFELTALKKPAVVIPLPWSAYGEQQKQAEVLKNAGVAEIFDQSDNSSKLLALIEKMVNNIKKYQVKFNNSKLNYSQNAAKVIISSLLQNHLQNH